MVDVFEVSDILVSHAVETHGDEIDLIGYYGSHAQGTATARSDLDIFYTPSDGKHPPLGRCVLIDGVLFDFWAIPWETLEGFATGRIRGWAFAPAVVHHARVLHARTDTERDRLAALKQTIAERQAPEAKVEMVGRARDAFRQVMTHLGNVRVAGAVGEPFRPWAWSLIAAVCECLTLANQTFFNRGIGHILEELSRLPARPPRMEELVVTMSTSTDPEAVATAAERLAVDTRTVLAEFRDVPPPTQEMAGAFEGAYPEISDIMRKATEAGDHRSAVVASAATWILHSELGAMCGGDGGGPRDVNLPRGMSTLHQQLVSSDLVDTDPNDTRSLAEHVHQLDSRLRQWLSEHSVDLHEFETVDAFRRSL